MIEKKKKIEKINFGRSGHCSTRTIFGAAALSDVTQKEADETCRLLYEYGINHIDTAASYGLSEERLGPFLKKNSKDFFLATKTEKRTYREALEELHRSLERMQVDHVDLWQMHCLVDAREWEIAFGQGGVLEAFLEARQKGLCRFLGITGHGLSVCDMHMKSLDQHDFDSVLLPYNYMLMQNQHYAESFEKLYQRCRQENRAFQTIKSIAIGEWTTAERSAATWYKPLDKTGEIKTAVNWVLSKKGIFLNTCGDIHILPRVLEAAAAFKNANYAEEMAQLAESQSMKPLFPTSS